MHTLGTRIGPYPIGASCPFRVVAPAEMTPVARALDTARTRPWMREHLAAQAEPTPPSDDDSEPEPTAPAPVPFDRANHCRQIGTLGGQKTARTYGRRYMAEIGKIGFAVYAARHHNGNRAAALGSIRAFRDPDARVRQPGPYRQLDRHAA